VWYENPNLGQTMSWPLEPIIVYLPPNEFGGGAGGFPIEWTLVVNELSEQVAGKLNIKWIDEAPTKAG
jgi:hypothetical protein